MIETQQSSISYTADGVQTQWEFPYSYFSADDIKLFITQEGVRTQIAAENYTFNVTTKKVTYPLSGDPVAAGSTVELTRQTDITQLEDSSVQNFKSDDVERIADKLTLISQERNNTLDNKQDIIPDLSTIRSNAAAGKTASDTIATYGTVVTHDASEFATAAQGTKADSAIQQADLNITALNDVAISSPSAGQVLAYDATTQKWKNSSSTASVAWGGVTGTLSNQTDLQSALNSKQATISDLETIRSGAALGATAVQPGQLATVATSGSYNDLTDKPSSSVPTITWFKNKTGSSFDTGISLSNANLVKVYKNGLLLQPSLNEIEEITFTSDSVSKYIKLNNALDLSKDFEINFTQNFTNKIGTWNFWLQGTTFNSAQNGIGEATDGCSIRFIVRDSNAYGVWLSSDGSSSLVDSWGWGSPTLNKEYDCRLTYTKSSTTFNIKIKEHSSLDWAINTNVSTNVTSLFSSGGYLRFYPSGEMKLSSIKVYSEGNPFFIGLQSNDYTNVGCTETTQMSSANDYVITSNSLVFTTALENTDKIAVEVF